MFKFLLPSANEIIKENIMGCESTPTAKEIAKEVVQEITKLLSDGPAQKLQICPVCAGRGVVSQGFYGDCSPTVMLSGNVETCRSCCGIGYLNFSRETKEVENP